MEFLQAFIQYLSSAYKVPGMVLGTGDIYSQGALEGWQ